MKKSGFYTAFTLLAVLTLLVFSCKKSDYGSVEREDLFTLDIGPMEDQIALYRLDGNRGIRKTGFTMRDGTFYISDGNGGKIVRYNPYGDLLFMIYNEETNPPPITLKNINDNEQVTRWAFPHELEGPGWITVDSKKHIFVEDRVPVSEQRFDPESKVLLDGIIKHFDQDGRYVKYLGREGEGGTYFPRIVGLSTSVRDELAVICRIQEGWIVYWYNSQGALLFVVNISVGTIPGIPEWPEAFAAIDSISIAPDSRRILIKVDYTRDTFDPLTNTRTGNEPINSVIWTLNIEDGKYAGSYEIPLYETTENSRTGSHKVFYYVLGVARNNKVLLYSPINSGYTLLYIDLNSREQRRAFINFSINEIRYNDFFLSNDGILSAMLADNNNVKMVWWRTDRFIGESP